MKTTTAVSAIALSLALATAVTLPLTMFAPTPAYAAKKQPKISAKVGKIVQEASELLKKEQPKDALAKLMEGAQISDKSEFETMVINDYMGQSYLALQDYANAGAAFEASYRTGAMPPEEMQSRLMVATQAYYQSGNYAKAVEFGNIYEKEVGADPEVMALVGHAKYASKDLQGAAATMRQVIAVAESKKAEVKEDWYHMIEQAEAEQKNMAGVLAIEETIAQRFPKKENWASLLQNTAISIKGSDKITLDIYRLMVATKTMPGAPEYAEATKLAIDQLVPCDAQKIVDDGFAAGVLSTGAHKDLRAKAAAAAEADRKTLVATEKEATAKKSGEGDVKFGEAFSACGMHDKAIAAVKRGIGKGVKDQDDAQLRLGLAQLAAGQRDEGLATLKAIGSRTTPSATVARLWVIYTENPPA